MEYTSEDLQVWSILYERQLQLLKGKVYDEFFDGLARLGFRADSVPRIPDISARLEGISGWRLQLVTGLIPPEEYFSHLSRKRFPTTAFLRTMSELDHCKRPDMFHDLFGHTALLIQEGYQEFLQGLSSIALQDIENARRVALIAGFNKWTTEFGLIEREGDLRIYGAGLISSSGEMDHCLGEGPQRLPADVETMLTTKHVRAEYQSQYFVIDSFRWLYDSLPSIESALKSLTA